MAALDERQLLAENRHLETTDFGQNYRSRRVSIDPIADIVYMCEHLTEQVHASCLDQLVSTMVYMRASITGGGIAYNI